ncbi:hypothetical protein [Streptomyces venezuelae]|nr:hypothetical protein [Streptomyces venezuelae]
MNAPSGRAVFAMSSPEATVALLTSRLRGHTPGCPDCRTEECEEGVRMRRALRAVRSLLKEPEPPAPPRPDRRRPMGTLTNGRTTIPYDNWTAPHLNWRKAGRTDLDPILKDCVILAEAPPAKNHPHHGIPDGTRMIAISDDKDPAAPVLLMSRVEMTEFFDGVIAGDFDEFRATKDELDAAAATT